MSRHEVVFLYRRTESVNSPVEYIGGYNSDGTQWKVSLEKAIDGIERGKWGFYIKANDSYYNIIVISQEFEKKLCIDFSNLKYLKIDNFSLDY